MDAVLSSDEDVKPDFTSETLLSNTDDPTCNVRHRSNIKEELSHVDLKTNVKQEEVQAWALEMEAPDLQHNTKSPIKLESLHYELDIKSELSHCNVDHTIIKSPSKLNSQQNNINANPGEKPVGSCKCPQKNNLQQHMQTHTREIPFKCDLCDYTCARRYNLKRHMKAHTGVKPFTCGVCKNRFLEKSKLMVHMRTHTGEKPFRCNVCGHVCAHKHSLERHMKIHTGEKPFQCGVCAHRFIEKNSLRVHMRRHTGEKPFKCSVCDNSFVQKIDLNRHMRIHTGEKLFKCNKCDDFRSAWKKNLQQHLKTHK